MKEIWFIRHCESQANAGLATFSPESIALTARGTEQSAYIPAFFTRSPELIVTSPFLRTKQTAEPTVLKFSNADTEEWKVQEFTYLSLTKYADTTMVFRRPFVQEYWHRSEANYCDGEGCESFAGFISRVSEMLGKIPARSEKTIAVFTHGQFIKAVLWFLLNDFPEINHAAMKSFCAFLAAVSVPNASITTLKSDDGNKFFASGVTASHLPKKLITQ